MPTIRNLTAAFTLALMLPFAGSAFAEGDWDGDGDFDADDLAPSAASQDDATGNGTWSDGDWNDEREAAFKSAIESFKTTQTW